MQEFSGSVDFGCCDKCLVPCPSPAHPRTAATEVKKSKQNLQEVHVLCFDFGRASGVQLKDRKFGSEGAAGDGARGKASNCREDRLLERDENGRRGVLGGSLGSGLYQFRRFVALPS